MRRLLLALLLATVAPRAGATGAPDVRRLAPVSVAGAPRTLVTLVVGVPAEVEGASRVRFQVVLSGAVEVIGRLEGELEMGTAARPRPVMLTLRVPATALVGLLDVADVVFTTDAGLSVAVPIILRVPSVLAVRVTGVRELAALDRGDLVELSYRVQNLGNDTERLAVQVQAPADWRVRVREGQRITVPAYGAADVTLSFRVPAAPNAGSVGLEVQLVRDQLQDSSVVASARTLLRVREQSAALPGIAFHPYLGAATSGDGAGLATGLRVVGPIADGVRLDASFAPEPTVPGLGLFGLASLGIGRVPINARLSADDWQVNLGVAQGGLSELTGVGFGGRGASGAYRTASREFSAIVAQPAARTGREGTMAGVGGAWDTPYGRFGGSISSLSEHAVGLTTASRELHAIGGEWRSPTLWASTRLAAGLAVRDHLGGTELGFRAALDRQTARDRVRIGVLHAPGGSGAFAAAAERYALDAERQLTDRVTVEAATQLLKDGSAVIRESRNRSASLGARVRLTDAAGLSLRLSDDASSADGLVGGAGGFGSRSQSVMTGAQVRVAGWQLSADARVSRAERSTDLFSGATDTRRALQRGGTFAASRPLGQMGVFSTGGSLVQSGAGLGLPENVGSAYLRVSSVPVVLAGELFRLEQEVRFVGTSLTPVRTALRSGVTTVLRSGYEVSASLERNPFLTDSRGRVGWIAAMRVSLTAELLTSDRLMTPGTVFRDLNGNGRRDEGERGVAGVTLVYDRMRFTTSRAGEYRVPRSYRGRLGIDPRTIPAGLVQHPRTLVDSVERRDIPLVPTGSVVLRLEVQLDPDGRMPAVNLDNADVWLRDADGFEWVGRHLGEGRVAFEHVPVGPYVVRTDFSRLAETVRADDVTFVLAPGDNEQVSLPVRGRSIRLITPPRQGGGRGGVAPRSGRTQRGAR